MGHLVGTLETKVAKRQAPGFTSSGLAEDLAVQDREPAIRRSRPGSPPVGDPPQVGLGGHPAGQQLPGQVGADDTVGPHPAPPVPVLGRGEAPHARRRGDLGEASVAGPGEQPAAGIRLAPVGTGGALVQDEPLVEFRYGRKPGECGVVAVAGGHHPTGPADPAELAQRADRMGQMLQHLVGVHHVEGVVGQVEGIRVGDPEVDAVLTGGGRLLAGQADHFLGDVHGGDLPGRHSAGEVDRDGAGSAADVEQSDAGPQVRQQVAGGVLDGAPPVRAQDRLVVSVGVGLCHGNVPLTYGARRRVGKSLGPARPGMAVSGGTARPPPPRGEMETFLETERLVLRRFTPADLDHLVELESDPEVMRYLTGGKPTPPAVVRDRILPKILAYYDRHPGLGWWAAVSRTTGEFLGWFALTVDDGAPPSDVELGYRLRRPAWGKGYATEGSRTLIHKAFSELGAERVYAETMAVNTASRRVMEKAGLRYVRTFHLEWDDPIEGTEHGEVEYELRRVDWATSAR